MREQTDLRSCRSDFPIQFIHSVLRKIGGGNHVLVKWLADYPNASIFRLV